ncbi:MAG: hypothetical protein HRT69_15630 [Flavobacteriaceae bacterium]|nr:hypothetical protein [Flavobacteriaceae bacterium]
MIKNIIALILLCSTVHINAQSDKTFIVKGNSINNENIPNSGKLDISKITVINISNKAIFLEWKTISNTFPKGWDCSMCQHGACQIGIPKGSVFKKLNPDQEGFIAIHVMPQKNIGNGQVKFKIYDRDYPEEFEILTFNVDVL